ncbi:hypothetical protein [Xinfangfangia pollutisoli]|uniref:hypothetical protein n=1 Tax=Xinfangfangia pollutisoli TaxID=2865960 RepID=UPI001CD7D6BB|nr:hypothetical protein [Xinfangfangia pollutisoli]
MTQDPRPIRADVTPEGLVLDEARLARKLAELPEGAPVVAMVHGWRYAPDLRGDCPHGTILGLDPPGGNRRVVSWPRHLGLDGCQGLAIGLGWQARCGLWTAHRRARLAGAALAEIAERVAHLAPGRRLQVIGHSLGARVALNALAAAPPGRFGRLILLAAAETRGFAEAALASPAGRAAEIVNVTTRENDLYDALFEWGVHLGLRTSVGQGLGRAAPNWRDLWIDHPETRAALAGLGHALPPPPRRICHWSPYLRPGIFALYRALLEGSLPLQALPPPRPARRWSRLFTHGGAWDLGPPPSLPQA